MDLFLWFRLFFDKIMKLVEVGDRLNVRNLGGMKGNVIGRLSDGRDVLFDCDNPYTRILAPDQSVDCRVIRVHPNYVIVNPISKPVPMTEGFRGQRPVDEHLMEELESLADAEDRYASTIARALLHI